MESGIVNQVEHLGRSFAAAVSSASGLGVQASALV